MAGNIKCQGVHPITLESMEIKDGEWAEVGVFVRPHRMELDVLKAEVRRVVEGLIYGVVWKGVSANWHEVKQQFPQATIEMVPAAAVPAEGSETAHKEETAHAGTATSDTASATDTEASAPAAEAASKGVTTWRAVGRIGSTSSRHAWGRIRSAATWQAAG